MANQPFMSLPSEDDPVESERVPAITPAGPRKLIRPSLSPSLLNRRTRSPKETPLTSHQATAAAPAGNGVSSHAEAFYFQKQMQSQTLMIFILEDGERVEGAIEWYDTATIKVRQGNVRTLIYKSAIKYLYKAGEVQP
jgi:sRNA-binding regulator protein Hfq